VNAQSFVNARFEEGKAFDLIPIRGNFIFGAKLFIQLFVKLGLDVRVMCKVVDDRARRARRSGWFRGRE